VLSPPPSPLPACGAIVRDPSPAYPSRLGARSLCWHRVRRHLRGGEDKHTSELARRLVSRGNSLRHRLALGLARDARIPNKAREGRVGLQRVVHVAEVRLHLFTRLAQRLALWKCNTPPNTDPSLGTSTSSPTEGAICSRFAVPNEAEQCN
jgi:hypothetical protein